MLRTIFFGAVFLVWGSTVAAQTDPCHVTDHETLVECGSLSVPLDYAEPDGDAIDVSFVRLARFNPSSQANPLFFLAGGPGQSATSLAHSVSQMLSAARAERDIVLIDQRGTGESAALQCDIPDQDFAPDYDLIDSDLLRGCVSALPEGIANFTTANAIRDFELVREYLGYSSIDLYGGSYGTRAAYAYIALAPDSVGSVVLDGIAPPAVPIGLFGKSAEAAFDRAIERCGAVPECASAFPDLRGDFDRIEQTLLAAPIETRMPHPTSGEIIDVRLWHSQFIGLLRLTLYAPDSTALLPSLITEAAQGNILPLITMAASVGDLGGINQMLLFTIICNEDYPRFTQAQREADVDNRFGGPSSLRVWEETCPLMPAFDADLDWMAATNFPHPTLLLSGTGDPVTPPSNGEVALQQFNQARHIVVEEAAHIVAGTQCGGQLIADFLDNPDPESLDTTCVDSIPKQRFRVNTLGSLSPAASDPDQEVLQP